MPTEVPRGTAGYAASRRETNEGKDEERCEWVLKNKREREREKNKMDERLKN